MSVLLQLKDPMVLNELREFIASDEYCIILGPKFSISDCYTEFADLRISRVAKNLSKWLFLNGLCNQKQTVYLENKILEGSFDDVSFLIQSYIENIEVSSLLLKLMIEVFESDSVIVQPLLQAISKLRVKFFITLNCDQLMEFNYSIATNKILRRIYSSTLDLNLIRQLSNQPYIYKLIGDNDQPNDLTIDLMSSEKLNSNINHSAWLEEIYCQTHLLILGFDGVEPDLEYLLKKHVVKAHSNNNWLLIKENSITEKQAEFLMGKYNISIVEYKSEPYNSQQLLELFTNLNRSNTSLLFSNNKDNQLMTDILINDITYNDEPALDQKINIFYSYSHLDQRYREEISRHLSFLRREGLVSEWYDRQLIAGDEYDPIILDHLEKADIILLLVSSHFTNSDYCWTKEMMRAMEKHNAKEVVVIPIMVNHVHLGENTPFKKLVSLPHGGDPIEDWKNQELAYKEIAKGIHDAVNKILFA